MVALAVWYFGRDLPDYQQLADYQPPIVTRVHAGDGRLMAEYATEKRVFVPVSAMPPLVIHAFLAAEDQNFYSHPGIDPIVDAARGDRRHRAHRHRPPARGRLDHHPAGGEELPAHATRSRSQRKIKEALIAIKMEQVLSKDRILELYLNEIYLGGGAYGVAAAALNYFNKSLDELTVAEAAFLAALPKAPNNYNPAALSRGGAGAARLGDRPHGRGRLHHRRSRRRRRRRSRSRCASAIDDRDRQAPLFHRGGAARAAGALWREGALSRPGSRCAPASIRVSRRSPTRRCATRLDRL